MIKTILVPTDGSEHAKKAVLLAADIAEKFDARMVVLHVLSKDPLSASAGRPRTTAWKAAADPGSRRSPIRHAPLPVDVSG